MNDNIREYPEELLAAAFVDGRDTLLKLAGLLGEALPEKASELRDVYDDLSTMVGKIYENDFPAMWDRITIHRRAVQTIMRAHENSEIRESADVLDRFASTWHGHIICTMQQAVTMVMGEEPMPPAEAARLCDDLASNMASRSG